MANKEDTTIVIRADEKTKKAFDKVTRRIEGITTAGIAATASMAALGLAFATKEAIEFEEAINEISTLLDDTSQIDGMTEAVKQLSIEYGQAPVEEAGGLYQIISAGADSAAEAIQTLDAANKLAIGGVTDVETAADGLTSVLNAYGDQVKGATAVSDAMFVAMKAGKTTIAELSAGIGKVAPLAAQAGIGFDELLAATSAVTKGGIKTAEAVTGLRQVMVKVLKPTKEAKELSSALGIEFNAGALAAKGLSGFLADVMDKTRGSTEAMTLLFGSVESLTPALQLTGSQADDFNDILDSMQSKSGATEAAVAKMSKGTKFQLGQLKSEALTTADSVGGVLLPSINNLLNILNTGAADGGGLNVFVEGIFAAQMGLKFMGESMAQLALTTAQTMDFLPGTALLVSDEDIAALQSRVEIIQQFGLEIAEARLAEVARVATVKDEAAALLYASVAGREYNETIKTTAVTLNDLLGVDGNKTTPTLYWQQHEKGIKNTFVEWQVLDDQVQNYSNEIEAANKKTEELEKAGRELGLTFSSAAEDALVKWEGFGNAFQGIFEDIQRVLVRKTLTEPAGNFLGDLFNDFNFGDLFKAEGGPVSSGESYIVGERGPELFTPSSGGSITPNNALGNGGGDGMVYSQTIIIDARNSDVSEARLEQAVIQASTRGYQMMLNDFSRNGVGRKLLAG